MVDQIEIHPGMPQDDMIAYCREHNIVVEGWSRWQPTHFFCSGSTGAGEKIWKDRRAGRFALACTARRHSAAKVGNAVQNRRKQPDF